MVLKKSPIFILSLLLILGVFGFVFAINSGSSISTENSGVSQFSEIVSETLDGGIDYECTEAGFNYGVAKWECESGVWTVADAMGTSVTGDCDVATWNVGSSEADGIVVKYDRSSSSSIGTEGTEDPDQDISNIIFCGNWEAPVCGDGNLDYGEECDDGNNADGDGCTANCALEACVDSGEGPVTSDLTVIKLTDTCSVKIEATETDECSNIMAAEYFLGGATCGAEGTGTPMVPKDTFDSMIEEVIKNNVVVSDGSINVHVRGQDVAGNWGVCKTVRVDVDCLPPFYPTCEEGDDLQHDNGIALNGECNPEHILVCGDDPLLSGNICDDQSRIQLAEYFIDEDNPINWLGIPMDARDGAYDERCEDVEATIDLDPLEEGTHFVQLHGKDGQENWGKFTFNPEISFIKDTLPPETTKTIDFAGGISFPCNYQTAMGHDLTNGCSYVLPGTTITLSATDPDPQDTDEFAGDVVINWKIWYSNDCTVEVPEWTLLDSGMGEVDEDVMLTLTEDSCHLIEYWASDGCTNEERHHFELDIVDSKAPITEKEVGEPKVACADLGQIDCDYYITQKTPIYLTCTDQEPHPIDDVTLYWRDYLEGNEPPQWNVDEDGEVTIYKNEDSRHVLEWYCVDALGNSDGTAEEPHVEIDIVESVPPEITKEIVGPWYGQCPPRPDSDDVCYIDGVTEIRVTVTDPEPHPVNDVTCDWSYRVLDDDGASGGQQGVTPPFVINFPEESEHELTIYCEDALGNSVRDVETFLVDKTAPVTTKEYGLPFFSEEPEFLEGSFGSSGTGTAEFVGDSAHLFAPLITDFPPSNEGRVRIEFTGMTLNELNTISWDANVIQGYLPHVDVFLGDGKVLVFEYAKVDPALCDNAPYPTGILNTFDDKGIVDDSAYAWLSSGPAGPCGDETFDANHNSLADWKLSDGGQDVLAIEIEVDGWISTSEADVNNIMINGEEVIIDPEFESNAVHWINSDTPITLTVDDAGPHKSGIDRTQYRTSLVDDDYCLSQTVCQSAEGTGDWNDYDEDPFTIDEESCHLIEYYSVDNVNKTEMVNKQCVFVDNSAPETDKVVGEPKSLCEGGEEFCGPQGEWQSWFITGETNVTLSCEDPEPHPVDHEKLCFAISWHVDRDACAEAQGVWNEDKGFCYLTDNYVSEFVEGPGYVEDNQYYCLYLDETNEFEFHFLEDSLHNIEWYCKDILGNRGELNVEWDNVDSKGPEIIIRNPTPSERTVEMCVQSIVATIEDEKSGVMRAWAELWNSSEVKVREVNLTNRGGYWDALMDKALPAGEYTLKVCAEDNNGNENCVPINETLVETVFVERITPAVCGIDPEEGGECDFTYNICMRGGNGIKFWMNKLGEVITPGMMGATISDEDGNAIVGLRHESGLSQEECEEMSTWDEETFWIPDAENPEVGACWFISGDAEFLQLSCQEINGREKFDLHLELDGEDVSLIGPGVHDLEYWIESMSDFEGCVEPPPAPEEEHVVINEFLSNPLIEADEWVELYNPTDSDIDLTNWKLGDNDGHTATLSGTLSVGDYLVVEFSSVLNNDGDTIELKDGSAVLVDSVAYGDEGTALNPSEEKSAGRSPNGMDTDNDLSDFAVFDIPTPGAANL